MKELTLPPTNKIRMPLEKKDSFGIKNCKSKWHIHDIVCKY